MKKRFLRLDDSFVLPIGLSKYDIFYYLKMKDIDIESVITKSIDDIQIFSSFVGNFMSLPYAKEKYDEEILKAWYLKNVITDRACSLISYFDDSVKFLAKPFDKLALGVIYKSTDIRVAYDIMKVSSGYICFPENIIQMIMRFNNDDLVQFLENFIVQSLTFKDIDISDNYFYLDSRFEQFQLSSAIFY